MLEKLIREARESDANAFLALVRRCISTIKHSTLPNAKIRDGYIELVRKNAVIVGDLHGDLDALEVILNKSKFFDKHLTIIFLGDYGDRGRESVEVYHLILNLKVRFPERVILLRGNHECLEFPFAPHDLPIMLYERFGDKSEIVYERLKDLFHLLYYTLLLNGKYLILHGGVPVNTNSRDDLNIERLEEILWNDPRDEIKGYMPSWRGYGYYFGRDVTIKALEATGTTNVIRAHEPCNGYKTNHNGLVLTIFSCKAPYGNREGSYLRIEENISLLDGIEIF